MIPSVVRLSNQKRNRLVQHFPGPTGLWGRMDRRGAPGLPAFLNLATFAPGHKPNMRHGSPRQLDTARAGRAETRPNPRPFDRLRANGSVFRFRSDGGAVPVTGQQAPVPGQRPSTGSGRTGVGPVLVGLRAEWGAFRSGRAEGGVGRVPFWSNVGAWTAFGWITAANLSKPRGLVS